MDLKGKNREMRPLWHFPPGAEGQSWELGLPCPDQDLGEQIMQSRQGILVIILNGAGAALCQPSDTVPAF